ncbi:cation-transporting P-type ATPase [Vibrio sp. SCSIO 43140]|uniref:cation-translocating P-type ATPase n=1 Tax=Vibrio sp. SCSIO 43140 TaxID=2819100 RepID=UPI0020764403|nr:cation-transporting P-type ATPase [Vibrio sp. SCSIO 43140]
MKTPWFNISTAGAINNLQTTKSSGLCSAEAASRLEHYGENALTEAAAKPMWQLYLEQYKNPLVFILAIGSIVSAMTGHMVDAIAIAVIIMINTGISFWQERKAHKGMQALKEMAAPQAEVIRDSNWQMIPAKELVPGDIIKLNTGDILPADVRILEAHQLAIDEAALTGESEPVTKSVDTIGDQDVTLGDQKNMAFMTTMVTTGNGLGVVTATGMQTEVGHIAEMMNQTPLTKSPMQVRMDNLAHLLLFVGLGIVALVCGVGFYHGMPVLDILTTGISLSVAAIPEGLPTVVTIVLTMGSTRMAKNNALAKQLSAIESLGSVTVICSDKTGTLTQNQMQVVKAYDTTNHFWDVTGKGFEPKGEFVADGHDNRLAHASSLNQGLLISALCSDSKVIEQDGKLVVQGSPTEGAMVVAAAKAGFVKDALLCDGGYQIIKKFPFDSTRKMASAVVKSPNGDYFLAVKGAPDVLLTKASSFQTGTNFAGMSATQFDNAKQAFETAIDRFANQALRTIAVGFKPLSTNQLDLEASDLEQDFCLTALFGIIDPPRPEVKEAIEQCYRAGVRTVMITGDHAATAKAIAKEIGIIRRPEHKVLTGTELDHMDDNQLRAICPSVAVFARVTPEHKLRIVKAQQENLEVASMTGDGVNDAPALKRADIGVAMGITGTSVAKDSGDMILLDDNFSTIVKAVRQGRQIFDNLRKFMRQALTANVAEVSVILFAFLAMGPETVLPLTPLMILWVNLVSDGLPALALGMEPQEHDLMDRKPRKRNEPFFSDGLGVRILTRGLALGALSYVSFAWALNSGFSTQYAQTIAFLMLIFAQLWHLFDSRTFTTLFRKNPFTNLYLLGAIALSATLSLCVVYTSMGQYVFSTEPLALHHLSWIVIVSGGLTFVLSSVKELTKTKWL